MSETLHPGELSAVIASILNSRNWYRYDSSNNFNWDLSLEALAQKISQIAIISKTELKELIESSFDSNTLTETKNGEEFINCLLEIDPNLIVWTEGDSDWQETKAEKTGIKEKVRAIFYHPHKIEILEEIVSQINESETKLLIVIDDKADNLQTIRELNKKFKNIKIVAYQLDLDSKKQNPDSCLIFIQKRAKRNKTRIISDLDRVLINPEKVFTKIVSEKIARKIISSR